MDDKKKITEQENTADNQLQNKTENEEQKAEGSGIFTTDGEELPKIEGGYDISGPGGTLGDNEFE